MFMSMSVCVVISFFLAIHFYYVLQKYWSVMNWKSGGVGKPIHWFFTTVSLRNTAKLLNILLGPAKFYFGKTAVDHFRRYLLK